MKFYCEFGKENIVYFYIDITEEMQQLWGKEIVKRAQIISPEYCSFPETEIKNFFNNVKHEWETNKNIYHGKYDFIVWFTNGKMTYLDGNSQWWFKPKM